MGILLWALKPILYVVMFGVAAGLFRRALAASAKGIALRAIGGGLGRVMVGGALGLAFARVADGIPAPVLYVLFGVCGLVGWLGVAAVAFRGVGFPRIAGFAVVGEIIGGAIDAWALHDASHIRFC